jgi:hypothetical protein
LRLIRSLFERLDNLSISLYSIFSTYYYRNWRSSGNDEREQNISGESQLPDCSFQFIHKKKLKIMD